MIPTYPDDCFQAFFTEWWLQDEGKELRRGRLIWAFVPHVDQVPCALNPIGRTDDKEHSLADCEIAPVDISSRVQKKVLPVAGLMCHDGEVRTVYRAKKRPMLLVALAGTPIPPSLTLGKPKHQTSATHLAIPYYGGNADGKRAGFKSVFLERVRKCEFPQFSWDKLPLRGADESVLRIDHVQHISTHYKSYAPTEYYLSPDAMSFIDEWVSWHFSGGLPEDDSPLGYLRMELQTLD